MIFFAIMFMLIMMKKRVINRSGFLNPGKEKLSPRIIAAIIITRISFQESLKFSSKLIVYLCLWFL